MASKIAAAIDGLLTLTRNLQATSLLGVDIYDGPKLDASQNGRRLFIGFHADGIAAEGDQEWASMPQTGSARAEAGPPPCVAQPSTGQEALEGRPDGAFADPAPAGGSSQHAPAPNGPRAYPH